MRIAIDTNVLVAALTNPGSSGARVVRAWRRGRVAVVASEATLREAELVLGAAWLARLSPPGEVEGLLAELCQRTLRVQPSRLLDLRLQDAGDRRLVEAAVEGNAAYLVTTDRELLRQRGYGQTEFVTPPELLRALRDPEGR